MQLLVEETDGHLPRLEAFFAAKKHLGRRADSIAERLAEFLDEAKPLIRTKTGSGPSPTQDPIQLARILMELREPLVGARNKGLGLISSIVDDLGDNEVRVTAFLAKLWSSSIGGETAISYLDAFLRRADRGEFALPSLDVLRTGYSISCEQCPIGDRRDRLDMVIEGSTFIVAIEVKIRAPEGDDQLSRYASSLKTRASALGKSSHFVFLSPRPPSDLATHATWVDVARAIHEGSSARQSEWSIHHEIANAFASHVRRFQ